MGVKNISKLFDGSSYEHKKVVTFADLKDRKLGIDAFNQLYQFLSSIRDGTGQSLVDESGRVTSHLIGILTRNSALLQNGVKPIYIFDGQSHPLKSREKKRRADVKKTAQIAYDKAVSEGDILTAQKFAKQLNYLTPQLIEDSKRLLTHMGIPIIDAPGEGEAQAAIMVKEGSLWATASQDYDAMLFGSTKLVRNLNITGKRTLAGGRVIDIKPELLELNVLLNGLNITHAQLIDLGILLGSDFNPDGISGIGPKTAYKLINEFKSFEEIEKNNTKVAEANIPYEEIREIFLNPDTHKAVKVDTSLTYDVEKIRSFLVDERGFSDDRYLRLIEKTGREIETLESQTSLDDWF